MINDDIVLTQHHSAAVDRVYRAWTDPQQVKAWWGPAAFTATEYQADLRPEGAWTATIVGPDGTAHGSHGTFTTVEPNRRLAFTFRWDDPDALDSHIVVDFVSVEDGTLVHFRQTPFKSTDDRDLHEAGWRELLAKSDRYVAAAK